jgi:hypothetical protein
VAHAWITNNRARPLPDSSYRVYEKRGAHDRLATVGTINKRRSVGEVSSTLRRESTFVYGITRVIWKLTPCG